MRKITFQLKNFIIFILLISVMITSYLLYFGKNIGLQNSITVAGVLYVLAFVLGLYVIKSKTGSFISLMTFFWVSFLLFHGSQVVLNIIGIDDYESYNIFKIYSLESIISATLYSTICEVMFCFGMLLNKVQYSRKSDVDVEEYFSVLRKFSKVFLGISVLPFFYYVFTILRTGIDTGYGAINDYSNYGSSFLMKIVTLFVDIFVVGAFFAMISYYSVSKTVYRISIGIIAFYSMILLMLGERTEPTSLILLVLWLDGYLNGIFGYRSKSKKKKILAVIVLMLLVIVFPSVMALRHDGIITLSALIADIRQKGVFESFKESVAGLGYSMMPLIEVRRLVSYGEPLRHGLTYLAACTNVVPYLGFAEKYASLAQWLMHSLNMKYGPGFSMAAEAYLNYGDYPVSMILFGFLFSKVLMWKKDEVNIKKMIRGIIFITTCLTLPRREISGRMRDIVYLVILLPMFIDYIYNKRMAKKGYENRL